MNFLDFVYVAMAVAGGMIYIISMINLSFSTLKGGVTFFIVIDIIIFLIGYLLFIFSCSHFVPLRFI